MKKSYYAIIPAEVRYSKASPNAKLLYGEITALCNEKGYCWASNQYFAELYEVHRNTVSKWVAELESHDFIKVVVKKNYSRMICLSKKLKGVQRKAETPYNEKLKGVQRKAEKNITVNNTDNIKYNKVIGCNKTLFKIRGVTHVWCKTLSDRCGDNFDVCKKAFDKHYKATKKKVDNSKSRGKLKTDDDYKNYFYKAFETNLKEEITKPDNKILKEIKS
jgi:DNA-binding transcriptional regulator YhcF (GntR family)